MQEHLPLLGEPKRILQDLPPQLGEYKPPLHLPKDLAMGEYKPPLHLPKDLAIMALIVFFKTQWECLGTRSNKLKVE